MSYESELRHGETTMTPTTSREEQLQLREHLFVPGTMEDLDIFCGDDRQGPDALHLFGGGANVPYTMTVVRETLQPGSVTEGFDTILGSYTPTLIRTGKQRAGIHSDDSTEHGIQLDIDNPDIEAIGCAFLGKRAPINRIIVDNADTVLEVGRREAPELFVGPDNEASSQQIIHAYDSLDARAGFLPSGRTIAKAALIKGAKPGVVIGKHTAQLGIINEKVGSRYDTNQAVTEGLPAYVHDEWIVRETASNLHPIFPYDMATIVRANYIDTIGTFLALGIHPDNIVVRR